MPDEVESVTIRLASLELTISVRRLDSVPSSSLGFEVVSTVPESVTSSVLPTAPEEPVLIFDFEAGIEDRVIATQTARTLEQLPLPFLAYLVVKLRSGVEGWSPKARIARAFRAGVIAGRRLNGIVPREQPLNSSEEFLLHLPSQGRRRSWILDLQLRKVSSSSGGARRPTL